MKYRTHTIESMLLDRLDKPGFWPESACPEATLDALTLPPRSMLFHDPPPEQVFYCVCRDVWCACSTGGLRPGIMPHRRGLWVVADLHPEEQEGLLVVFNPRIGMEGGRFGLARKDVRGRRPTFLGYSSVDLYGVFGFLDRGSDRGLCIPIGRKHTVYFDHRNLPQHLLETARSFGSKQQPTPF